MHGTLFAIFALCSFYAHNFRTNAEDFLTYKTQEKITGSRYEELKDILKKQSQQIAQLQRRDEELINILREKDNKIAEMTEKCGSLDLKLYEQEQQIALLQKSISLLVAGVHINEKKAILSTNIVPNDNETNVIKEKRLIPIKGVAFSTYLDHSLSHVPVGQTVVFNQVLLNDGNNYNSNTGVFECPYTGVYLFMFYVAEWSQGQLLVKLIKDGSNIVDAVTNPIQHAHDQQGGNAAIIHCAMGSSVYIETYYTPDTHMHSEDHVRFCTFSGVLLY